jgi:replicative DNA helicase
VGLDYVQLMDGREDVERGANRERELAEVGRRIKLTAKAKAKAGSRITWILLSQLNEDGRARESKALEMHADNIWVVSRESEAQSERWEGKAKTRRAKIRIPKQREGARNVVAETWFHEAYTLFSDADHPGDP